MTEDTRVTTPSKPPWTKETVAEVARGFETRTAFRNGAWGAYRFALRKGYIDEVCAHMGRKTDPTPAEGDAMTTTLRSHFTVSTDALRRATGDYEMTRQQAATVRSVCADAAGISDEEMSLRIAVVTPGGGDTSPYFDELVRFQLRRLGIEGAD
jgi:hypothetical protein